MKGLPASGKSGWAKAYITTHPGTVRVNNDDLRLMMHGVQFSPKFEDGIALARRTLIRMAMANHNDIIVDNCNLSPKAEAELVQLANDGAYELEWQDFTDVPLHVCIERDAKRGAQSVGKKVINRMHRQFLQKPHEPPTFVEGLPYAVICDIDGTLAHVDSRDIYDAAKAIDDVLDETISEIVKHRMDLGDRIIYCSGRDEAHRGVTLDWLIKHDLIRDNTRLLMRAAGDNREDSVVKTEIFQQEIAGKYNVRFVLDDRARVVESWRALGLKCLQVAEGEF